MIDYHMLMYNLEMLKQIMKTHIGLSKTDEMRKAYEYVIRYVDDSILAFIPEQPYGFNVSCSEDAPEFKQWRKIAWFADEFDFSGFAFQHARGIAGAPDDGIAWKSDGDGRVSILAFNPEVPNGWTVVYQYRLTPLAKPATIEAGAGEKKDAE